MPSMINLLLDPETPMSDTYLGNSPLLTNRIKKFESDIRKEATPVSPFFGLYRKKRIAEFNKDEAFRINRLRALQTGEPFVGTRPQNNLTPQTPSNDAVGRKYILGQ